MIFIYEKGTNKMVGFATQVMDNGVWREATIEEMYPEEEHSKLGFVKVKDSPKYVMNPDAWQFTLDEDGTPVGIERKPQPPRIVLSTDAKDTDGDGLPELPADGESKGTINIEIQDVHGKLVKEDFELKLSTTGGALSQRRLTAKKGKAKVELQSITETITITVSVTGEGLESGEITFELMP